MYFSDTVKKLQYLFDLVDAQGLQIGPSSYVVMPSPKTITHSPSVDLISTIETIRGRLVGYLHDHFDCEGDIFVSILTKRVQDEDQHFPREQGSWKITCLSRDGALGEMCTFMQMLATFSFWLACTSNEVVVVVSAEDQSYVQNLSTAESMDLVYDITCII